MLGNLLRLLTVVAYHFHKRLFAFSISGCIKCLLTILGNLTGLHKAVAY
jgi:hypothetical protein